MPADMSLFEGLTKKPDFFQFPKQPTGQDDVSLFTEEIQKRQTGAGGSFEAPFHPLGPPPDKQIDVTNIVGGGLLRMIEGIVTLPTDIIGAFGSRGAEKISTKIREFIPNIEPEGTWEDVGQTLVQYGIPAGTSIKLVHGLMKGTPAALRFTADILGGGLADFAVADPSDTTSGDWIGGPTKRKKGEKALISRAKIGVEGAAIPATLAGPFKLAGKAAKWATTRVFPTNRMVEDALSATLYKQSLDPQAAIRNIREGLQQHPGFRPTAGTLSQDPGLIAAEKGAAAQSQFAESSARLMERKQLNMGHISDELERVTQQRGGDPEEARKFFFEYLDKVLEGKTNAYEEAGKALKAVDEEVESTIKGFARDAQLEPRISELLNETVTGELKRVTSIKNQLYGAIDPGRTVEIPKDRLRAAFRELIKKKGPLDSAPSKISGSFKARISASLRKGTKEKPTKILTFGDLQDLRPDLSDAIAIARAENQGDVVKRLVKFKEAVEAESEYLALSGGEGSLAAAKANAFYRNEYVPRFKEYVGDNFRKAIRKGRPIPPTDVAGKFLVTRNGTKEASEQLRLILKESPNRKAAEVAAEDYIVGILAEQLKGVDTSRQATRIVDKFLGTKEVRDTLRYFPQAKEKVRMFRRGLDVKKEAQTALGQRVETAKQFLSFTQKEIKMNAAKWFVDSEPTKAMRRVLDSANPERAMDSLLTLASKDPSGNAKKGLRVALDNLLESPVERGGVRGSQEILGKNFEVYGSKIRNLFDYPPTRKAIAKLYNPGEMQIVKSLHEKIKIMNRINLQVTAGSPTAILQEAVRGGQILAYSLFGVVKGRGIFMISRAIQKALGRDPIEKAYELLTDAMLDPELAATLLIKGTPKNLPKIKSKLATYMLNNFVPQREQE